MYTVHVAFFKRSYYIVILKITLSMQKIKSTYVWQYCRKVDVELTDLRLSTSYLLFQGTLILYMTQLFIILACDWSKCVMWLNMPHLKLGNFWVIFLNFCAVINIWRIINSIASIWLYTMPRYLSSDITCSLKLTVFLRLCMLVENYSLQGTDNVSRRRSWHIFPPNGGYCLYKTYM